MKITDAFWEKRNLGVTTIEITIENTDSIPDLETVLMNLKNPEYVVLKVPSTRVEYIKYLTDQGFYFVETQSEMQLDLANFNVPKKLTRFDEKISYKLLPVSQLETLGVEIKKGIFNTDRIALDTSFGIDVAANRYFNWIKDEVSKGNCMYEIIYDEKPIGFFGIKHIRDNAFDNFLAGMYTDRSNFGFGFSTLTKSIEEIIKRNGRYLITHVSSNNISVIRLYVLLGFMLNDISYIMIKHFNS